MQFRNIQSPITDLKHPNSSSPSLSKGDRILNFLFTTDKRTPVLSLVDPTIYDPDNTPESIAKHVLEGLEAVLSSTSGEGKKVTGRAFKEVFDEVNAAINGLLNEHTGYVEVAMTIFALGMLQLMAPPVIKALGFMRLSGDKTPTLTKGFVDDKSVRDVSPPAVSKAGWGWDGSDKLERYMQFEQMMEEKIQKNRNASDSEVGEFPLCIVAFQSDCFFAWLQSLDTFERE